MFNSAYLLKYQVNMNKSVQQKNPIEEFYIAAREYCKFIELAEEQNKLEFLSGVQKILTLIYLKASLLEKSDDVLEEEAEKFVQEEDWTHIQNAVAKRLGTIDKYIEVILPENSEPNNVETEGLSDCLADVYQDLKDFVLNYEIGNPDSLLAGLTNCMFEFDKYWGPRLLAILVNVHVAIYGFELMENDDLSENSDEGSNQNSNSDNWLINQRFNQ